jgi:hypothetical protein
MTPEETIETIKIAQAEVEWNYPMDYAVAFDEAIKVLEKQIPRKVIPIIYKLYHGCNCPVCGRVPLSKGFNYCFNCGQKLDWDNIE